MKCLVTGATGFLGNWLVQRLLKENCQVRVLHRKNSKLAEQLPKDVEKFTGDILDTESLKLACKGQEAVFHLAGLIAYKKSEYDRLFQVNVTGTENVLKAARDADVSRVLHLSSVVAIGSSFTREVRNEESSYNMSSLKLGYFDSKHEAEKIVQKYHQEYKMDIRMVSPTTVYGPGDMRKGSRSTQLKVAKGKFPFYTAGGVNVIHIEDVIEGIWQAYHKARPAERYILGGENILIKELFEWIAAASGVEPPKYFLPTLVLKGLGRFGDLMQKMGKETSLSSVTAYTASMYHWFDNQKAKRELGLNPKPSRSCVEESIAWAKEQGLV